MNKENWTTIVFALEEYIDKIHDEGDSPTPHIYETYSLAVIELGNAK
jgi:hypothetical protein